MDFGDGRRTMHLDREPIHHREERSQLDVLRSDDDVSFFLFRDDFEREFLTQYVQFKAGINLQKNRNALRNDGTPCPAFAPCASASWL